MIIVYASKKKNDSDVGIVHLTKDDFFVPGYFTSLDKGNDVLNEIEKKIVRNQKIPQLFGYADFSFWWFVVPTIYLSLRESVDFIDIFYRQIENLHPTEVKVVGEFDKLPLIKQISVPKGIKITYSRFAYLRFLVRREMNQRIQKYRFKQITKSKIKARIQKLSKKDMPELNNKIVFAIATVFRRKMYDFTKKEAVESEYLVGPLMNILASLRFNMIGIDMDYTFKGQPEVLASRLREKRNWFPVESLINTFSLTSNEKQFVEKYLDIINWPEFREIFNYRNINFWNRVESDFIKFNYFPYLTFYLRLVESIRLFFKSNKPKAIFIPYEAGPLALAIIIASQENNIKTIGLQHGQFLEVNSDYAHTDFRTIDNPFGMPLPDHLLLFGNFSKKILLKNNTYPPEKLIVFGNPMYFQLEEVLQSLLSTDLRKKYGIPYNKKIILFTTGRYQRYYPGFRKQNYDELILQELLDKFANDEQYFVVLKPHPQEKFIKFYEDLIKNYNSSNFVIIQDDLFELLWIADLVVCYFSTVLIDAVAFGKITMQVAFDEWGSAIPFDEHKVVLTSDLKSMGENIKKSLSDNILLEKLLSDRESFLKEHFNIPNDKVIEQITSLLGTPGNKETNNLF